MSARMLCGLALAALAFAAAPAARAQDAPGDSLVRDYFRAISDSTDAYFGLSAQPADTAGLDSAETWAIANPGVAPRPRRRLAFGPAFTFNRAVGAMYGGSVSTGVAPGWGRVGGTLAWANGPDDLYGHGQWTLQRPGREEDTGWSLELGAGRRAEALNRDYFFAGYATVAALLYGADRHSYVRRDGVRAALSVQRGLWRAGAAYRNELESPLATTAWWSLTGGDLEVVENRAAAFGRASEVRLSAGARVPGTPFSAEAAAWNAGGALGGDLAYHRYRFATGGGLGLGRHLVLATQAEYARLTGAALPQDLLYLGGQYSLVTVDSQSLEGTGRAVARADLLLHDDVLQLLGLRRNSAFPIQVGAFASTGSRWGYDPATGVARTTARDWPGGEQWLSEAGLSVMYRPGLPEPDNFIRIDYAWPVGPHDREAKLFVSWKRTLHLLRNR